MPHKVSACEDYKDDLPLDFNVFKVVLVVLLGEVFIGMGLYHFCVALLLLVVLRICTVHGEMNLGLGCIGYRCVIGNPQWIIWVNRLYYDQLAARNFLVYCNLVTVVKILLAHTFLLLYHPCNCQRFFHD